VVLAVRQKEPPPMPTSFEMERAVNLHTSDLDSDLVFLSWTGAGSVRGAAAAEATAAAYAAMAEALAARGCVPVQERVFADLRLAPEVARGRAQGLGLRAPAWATPPTIVEGAPLGGEGIAGMHVIGARGAARPLVEGDACYGTIVETANARILGLSDAGRRADSRLAPGPAEDAQAAIRAAEELLAREGFSFRDVARTWFYLRDILEWYGSFNAVRNAAFRRMGLMGPDGDGQIPASTGIEGRNARGGWCALDLLALQRRAGGRLEMTRLHSRRQSEATAYGSAFARAMEVVLGDSRVVFVSGTASIDGRGRTVHAGDFETQARYTLEAVAALLDGAAARLLDIGQATVFLRNPGDARAFERVVERSALAAVPLVTTVADVCRDDLLFEIDATVVLPARGTTR
jgi:enamine deaminase RidA (YjgF/YER057c/UK114 family)